MHIHEYEKLAHSMELITRLPRDDSFVDIIGTGTEKTNLEALSHWVSKQDDILEIQPANYRLEKLVQRLQSTVDEFYSQFSY